MKGRASKNIARLLRHNTTETEKSLWKCLRSRRLQQYKFRRQQPFGDYIVDFCCLEKKLIIELDGGQHIVQKEYDEKRTQFLRNLGFRVIRFWDNEVLIHKETVLREILRHLEKSPSPQPSPLKGEG